MITESLTLTLPPLRLTPPEWAFWGEPSIQTPELNAVYLNNEGSWVRHNKVTGNKCICCNPMYMFEKLESMLPDGWKISRHIGYRPLIIPPHYALLSRKDGVPHWSIKTTNTEKYNPECNDSYYVELEQISKAEIDMESLFPIITNKWNIKKRCGWGYNNFVNNHVIWFNSSLKKWSTIHRGFTSPKYPDTDFYFIELEQVTLLEHLVGVDGQTMAYLIDPNHNVTTITSFNNSNRTLYTINGRTTEELADAEVRWWHSPFTNYKHARRFISPKVF